MAAGNQVPTGDGAIVLEFLFGVPVRELLRPAPPSSSLTVLRGPHPRTLSVACQVDGAMPASSLHLAGPPGGGGQWHLHGGGDIFDGTQVSLFSYEARPATGGAVIEAEDLEHVRLVTRTPRRSLLLASLGGRGRDALHVMDGVAARHRTALPFVRDLTVPGAYLLDEVTVALLWATFCFDDWLQADDALLAEERDRLAQGQGAAAHSGFTRSALPELSSAGAVWLGSHVCAAHAEQHFAGPVSGSGLPVLWSQVRGGPEAAAWLLLKDRSRVLDLIRLPGCTAPGRMAVCLPEVAVKAAESYERILLMLFAALVESRGIVLSVTDDPAYEAMDEVLVAGRMAVVGNWLPRGDGICAAATTHETSRVTLYADAAAHSVIAADDSDGRLRALADYLELDVQWLAGRCRELHAAGLSSLVRTRSLLLHTTGLETALAHLATLTR
ncbi:hypothetical protein [Streptomyces sp. NPDC059247]|uniref:hypothetical protein n=1 Tax=Streptomyces sp. NPDC059247 TaxID=3346790 RepID=UPI00367BC387